MQPQPWTTSFLSRHGSDPRSLTSDAAIHGYSAEGLPAHQLRALEVSRELEDRRANIAQAETALEEALMADDKEAETEAHRFKRCAIEAYYEARDQYDFHSRVKAVEWSSWNTREVIQLARENAHLKVCLPYPTPDSHKTNTNFPQHHVSYLESKCSALQDRADRSSSQAREHERRTQALEEKLNKLSSQVEEVQNDNTDLRSKVRFANCRVGCEQHNRAALEQRVDELTSKLEETTVSGAEKCKYNHEPLKKRVDEIDSKLEKATVFGTHMATRVKNFHIRATQEYLDRQEYKAKFEEFESVAKEILNEKREWAGRVELLEAKVSNQRTETYLREMGRLDDEVGDGTKEDHKGKDKEDDKEVGDMKGPGDKSVVAHQESPSTVQDDATLIGEPSSSISVLEDT